MAATPCIAQGVPPRHRALAAIARATEACTLASASSAVLSVGRGPCSPFYRAAAREDAVVATETRAAAHTWKQRSSATAAPSGDGSVESTIASAPSCAPATTSALGLDGVLPSTYGTSPHRPQASHGAEHSQKGVSRAQSSQSHEPARAYSTGRPWAAPEAGRRGRVEPYGLEDISGSGTCLALRMLWDTVEPRESSRSHRFGGLERYRGSSPVARASDPVHVG